MTVKDLKRKLELIPDSYDDFNVLVDDMDPSNSLLTLEKVYIGSMWNIILSVDGDDRDIEDNFSGFEKDE